MLYDDFYSQFISTTVTTIRVIMVVGVKDSDMEDSDAFAIEDTVEDYALVCFITYTY